MAIDGKSTGGITIHVGQRVAGLQRPDAVDDEIKNGLKLHTVETDG